MTQTEWMMRASEIVHHARTVISAPNNSEVAAEACDALARLLPMITDAPPPHRREDNI